MWCVLVEVDVDNNNNNDKQKKVEKNPKKPRTEQSTTLDAAGMVGIPEQHGAPISQQGSSVVSRVATAAPPCPAAATSVSPSRIR